MSPFVYLIRNKDLYKIGTTENMDAAITKLRPSEVISSLKTNKHIQVKEKLHNKYAGNRLPESEYFRLSKIEAEECNKLLIEAEEIESSGPIIGSNIVLFLLWWIGISGAICWTLIRPLFGGELF